MWTIPLVILLKGFNMISNTVAYVFWGDWPASGKGLNVSPLQVSRQNNVRLTEARWQARLEGSHYRSNFYPQWDYNHNKVNIMKSNRSPCANPVKTLCNSLKHHPECTSDLQEKRFGYNDKDFMLVLRYSIKQNHPKNLVTVAKAWPISPCAIPSRQN